VVLRFWYADGMLIFPAWFLRQMYVLVRALSEPLFAAQVASVLNDVALPWSHRVSGNAGLAVACQWVTGVEVTAVSLRR
jgi:hypothetical protein